MKQILGERVFFWSGFSILLGSPPYQPKDLGAWKVEINLNNDLLTWQIRYRYYRYSQQNHFPGNTVASHKQSLQFRLIWNHDILDLQQFFLCKWGSCGKMFCSPAQMWRPVVYKTLGIWLFHFSSFINKSSARVTSGDILQICIMAYQHTKAPKWANKAVSLKSWLFQIKNSEMDHMKQPVISWNWHYQKF